MRVYGAFRELSRKVRDIAFVVEDGYKGGFGSLGGNLIPFKHCKPRMLFDVGNMFDSFIGILQQQFPQQIPQILTPIGIVLWLLRFDHLVQLPSVLSVEGWKSMDQLVQDAAQTPPIDCPSMPFLVYDLRSHVLRSATEGEGLVIVEDVAAGESKISEFDVSVLPNEYVFWF